jgi:hypothetical protein
MKKKAKVPAKGTDNTIEGIGGLTPKITSDRLNMNISGILPRWANEEIANGNRT